MWEMPRELSSDIFLCTLAKTTQFHIVPLFAFHLRRSNASSKLSVPVSSVNIKNVAGSSQALVTALVINRPSLAAARALVDTIDNEWSVSVSRGDGGDSGLPRSFHSTFPLSLPLPSLVLFDLFLRQVTFNNVGVARLQSSEARVQGDGDNVPYVPRQCHSKMGLVSAALRSQLYFF